jgi:hypothetical protein
MTFIIYLYINVKDKKFGHYAKGAYTQLQWRFENVVESSSFPHGVKTTYRAYCCDKVVEIKKTNTSNAKTPIGKTYILKFSMITCKLIQLT